MTLPASNARRDFLKTVTTGAVLGQTSLIMADQQPTATSKAAAPDIVRGEVLRTNGTLTPGGSHLNEKAREIPVAGRSQVLVCGGGPAGIAAALAAALV